MSPSLRSFRPRKRIRHIHRWLGLIVALPLLWLSFTGILLNHSDDLGLDQKYISSPLLLRPYYQPPSASPQGIFLGSRWVFEWDQLLFLDHYLLPNLTGTLKGATTYQSDLVIATQQKLYCFDAEGTLVDTIDSLTLPALSEQSIQSLCTTKQGALLLKLDTQWWQFNDALTEATPISELNKKKLQLIDPLPVKELTEKQTKHLKKSLLASTSIPYSRLLLDAHSGRLLGAWGKWISTFSTIALIILILSGLRLFPKSKQKK